MVSTMHSVSHAEHGLVYCFAAWVCAVAIVYRPTCTFAASSNAARVGNPLASTMGGGGGTAATIGGATPSVGDTVRAFFPAAAAVSPAPAGSAALRFSVAAAGGVSACDIAVPATGGGGGVRWAKTVGLDCPPPPWRIRGRGGAGAQRSGAKWTHTPRAPAPSPQPPAPPPQPPHPPSHLGASWM